MVYFVNQFDFRKGRSVEDQLLVTCGEIVELVDRGFIIYSLGIMSHRSLCEMHCFC